MSRPPKKSSASAKTSTGQTDNTSLVGKKLNQQDFHTTVVVQSQGDKDLQIQGALFDENCPYSTISRRLVLWANLPTRNVKARRCRRCEGNLPSESVEMSQMVTAPITIAGQTRTVNLYVNNHNTADFLLLGASAESEFRWRKPLPGSEMRRDRDNWRVLVVRNGNQRGRSQISVKRDTGYEQASKVQ